MFTFHAEPMHEAYKGLLQFALEHSATFTLVTRHDLKTRKSHDQCLENLQSFLLEEREVSEWPGTRLTFDTDTATLRRYKAVSDAFEPLYGAGKGLYQWVQPALPEDLAFYDLQGRCWLASIAHEKMAFVDDSLINLKSLSKTALGVDLRPCLVAKI